MAALWHTWLPGEHLVEYALPKIPLLVQKRCYTRKGVVVDGFKHRPRQLLFTGRVLCKERHAGQQRIVFVLAHQFTVNGAFFVCIAVLKRVEKEFRWNAFGFVQSSTLVASLPRIVEQALRQRER